MASSAVAILRLRGKALAVGGFPLATSAKTFAATGLQSRNLVFGASAGGPIKVVHDEVAAAFVRHARGKPPFVSTAQFLQMLYEVGLVKVKETHVSEVLNKLMVHGFYRQTHPQKKDSYGPVPPPTIGLRECKRWATLIYLENFTGEGIAAAAASQKKLLDKSAAQSTDRVCGSSWCNCGTRRWGPGCALARRSWETARGD
mmetsp:Transcript_26584/g.58351  ORF Transcript_26584/g.58351 Transcript_26584/m.58351 type:complete len:201 (+) Transcript_26584:149-751(+)